ncbi:hypothetical protein V1527DRAFT_478274 [Lipomyces starkeyi]
MECVKWWAEIHIRKYPNFGVSTSSQVESSHGAMKSALTSSSSETIYTAKRKKINRLGYESSQQLSVIGSNRNMIVRLDIRNHVETAMLCTTILPAEVMKSLHQAQGINDETCTCTIKIRYLLPW